MMHVERPEQIDADDPFPEPRIAVEKVLRTVPTCNVGEAISGTKVVFESRNGVFHRRVVADIDIVSARVFTDCLCRFARARVVEIKDTDLTTLFGESDCCRTPDAACRTSHDNSLSAQPAH